MSLGFFIFTEGLGVGRKYLNWVERILVFVIEVIAILFLDVNCLISLYVYMFIIWDFEVFLDDLVRKFDRENLIVFV